MKTYTDSTLKGMKKDELIEHIRCLEYNLQGKQKILDYAQYQLEELVAIYDVNTNVLLEIQTRYLSRGLHKENDNNNSRNSVRTRKKNGEIAMTIDEAIKVFSTDRMTKRVMLGEN